MRLLRHLTVGILLALGLGAALTACGSSPPSSSGTTGATTSTSSTVTATTMSVTQSRVEITKAFTTLFDLANPSVSAKVAVVQDGPSLKATFKRELKTALAKRAGGAKVLAVRIEHGGGCQTENLTSPCAAVTYDILAPSRSVLLANSKGFAVFTSSKWLVSKATICTLLALANGNVAPKGC